jgi:hypothetical protein
LISLVFLVLGLAVGAIHVYLDKQPRTKGRVAQIFLLWQLVISAGVLNVIFFVGHTVFADASAAAIGWSAGSPFQYEVALANLHIGVMGILCYWIRGNFWIATVIAFSIQWLCSGVVHIREMTVAANYAPNNAGLTFYLVILIPVFVIALLVYYYRVNRQEEHQRSHPGSSYMGQVG